MILAIGFSAGANAIWRTLSATLADEVIHFIGFYPNQINNAEAVTPPCKTTIILPCEESQFDVVTMAETLRSKPFFSCTISEYHHGFMNPQSPRYDYIGAQTFTRSLLDEVYQALKPTD